MSASEQFQAIRELGLRLVSSTGWKVEATDVRLATAEEAKAFSKENMGPVARRTPVEVAGVTVDEYRVDRGGYPSFWVLARTVSA